MELQKRVNAFSLLSEFLSDYKFTACDEIDKYNDFDKAVDFAAYYNPWFTVDNILYALKSIGESIKKNEIEKWLTNYPLAVNNSPSFKKVGVVMAGNLPLVGFHDFFYILMSGNAVIAKLSSDDKYLLPAIANKLIEFEPGFADYIFFAENKLENFDAVIATGSNNSARYFEYYFGKYPHIIRKNRNAIAVLTGNETKAELSALSNDIMRYYGKGCRNVSKLFLPQNYDLNPLLATLAENENLIDIYKFHNNYDYYKSIYLINMQAFFDNGSIILKEEKLISSPVSVVYFEYYSDINSVNNFIKENEDQIQCVVSSSKAVHNAIDFGKAQQPTLMDYADGVDVMEFLLK